MKQTGYFLFLGRVVSVDSEKTFRAVVSAVKQPSGFFKEHQVFIFGKKDAQLCDSNEMVIYERHKLVGASEIIQWELDISNMHGCQLNKKVDIYIRFSV